MGWTITYDPYRLKLARGKNLFVDLGAERLIAAETRIEKIAIEVKSFRSPSEMKELKDALVQFVLYERLLSRNEPERRLYLVVPDEVLRQSVFEKKAGSILLEDGVLRLFTFNPLDQEIVLWLSQSRN